MVPNGTIFAFYFNKPFRPKAALSTEKPFVF